MIDEYAAGRRELRRKLREVRRAIPPNERIRGAERLARHLLELPFAPSSAAHVAGYWAMDGEIPLHAWQTGLPRDCVYCLPVLRDGLTLRFAPWKPGAALITNQFGIPEPDVGDHQLLDASQMDLVVVPLVGFDARGQRLGMGGGWYDRTFAFRQRQPAPPWLVGAGFASQQVHRLDVAPWDVSLDAACTDAGAHVFATDATVR